MAKSNLVISKKATSKKLDWVLYDFEFCIAFKEIESIE